MSLPTLDTPRLTLRPFRLADAPEVQRLAGDHEVAAGTLAIPHPYPAGAAEEWIGTHARRFEAGDGLDLALERRSDGALLGAIGLRLEREHARAELGYWIGKPYWGQGYATEAAEAIIAHAFETLKLNRVYAYHFARNAASGRVLQKAGMAYEGRRREHTLKWGEFLDDETYAILRHDHSKERSR